MTHDARQTVQPRPARRNSRMAAWVQLIQGVSRLGTTLALAASASGCASDAPVGSDVTRDDETMTSASLVVAAKTAAFRSYALPRPAG